MLASAVGFALIVSAVGDRTHVLVVAKDVPAGRVLKVGDLRSIEVAAESGVVPVADRAHVLGRRAKVPLAAGSLLASTQLSTRAGFPPSGWSQVALAVDPGGAPPDLAQGERVAVMPGPSDASTGKNSTEEAPPSAVVGTVTGSKAPDSSGGPRVVTVLMETGAVGRATQMEHPRVVVLPAVGREAP
ncbi:SAF domain-containing protein [Streptomyces sp. NPDC042319]|uniref:SAF domain-containing protein n=1 Tax=Streptomyces sp. NPDC042319 TaxID=3154332 RepID=UPI0033DAD5BE